METVIGIALIGIALIGGVMAFLLKPPSGGRTRYVGSCRNALLVQQYYNRCGSGYTFGL